MRDAVVNALIVTGCLLLVAGAAIFNVGLALAVAGVLCIAGGFLIAPDPRRR